MSGGLCGLMKINPYENRRTGHRLARTQQEPPGPIGTPLGALELGAELLEPRLRIRTPVSRADLRTKKPLGRTPLPPRRQSGWTSLASKPFLDPGLNYVPIGSLRFPRDGSTGPAFDLFRPCRLGTRKCAAVRIGLHTRPGGLPDLQAGHSRRDTCLGAGETQ